MSPDDCGPLDGVCDQCGAPGVVLLAADPCPDPAEPARVQVACEWWCFGCYAVAIVAGLDVAG